VTTSLPELVASLTAIRIGAIDLAIGNAFGSNAFNIVLFVPLDFLHEGSIFLSMSGAHAVTAFTVVLATAIAVLGQLYHGERPTPIYRARCIPHALCRAWWIVPYLFTRVTHS
jgi:cation:H+ antiporter